MRGNESSPPNTKALATLGQWWTFCPACEKLRLPLKACHAMILTVHLKPVLRRGLKLKEKGWNIDAIDEDLVPRIFRADDGSKCWPFVTISVPPQMPKARTVTRY